MEDTNDRNSRRLRWLVVILTVIGLCAAGGLAWPTIHHFLLTGSLFPIDKIDVLADPVDVTGWNADGLTLAGGRRIQLPSFVALPTGSAALAEATKRGVEIGDDGRIYALVRVHHWCGSDPVREHIARVDLAHMLIFLQEGESDDPLSKSHFPVPEQGGTFSEWGWRAVEFGAFSTWSEMAQSERAD